MILLRRPILPEEIEELGISEYRRLESRLEVLLTHLLKWNYQPARRGNSWRYTIQEQRSKLKRILKRNPSLKRHIPEALADAYEAAMLRAARETVLRPRSFRQRARTRRKKF